MFYIYDKKTDSYLNSDLGLSKYCYKNSLFYFVYKNSTSNKFRIKNSDNKFLNVYNNLLSISLDKTYFKLIDFLESAKYYIVTIDELNALEFDEKDNVLTLRSFNKNKYQKINLPDLKIKLLTWNICWECSDSSEKSIHNKLGKRCYEHKKLTNKNICLENIINAINSDNFDIIGLQEAKNWKFIYESLRNRALMGYIHHYVVLDNGNKADLVTFYNKERFLILAVQTGDIVPGNGRPYHIIFAHDLVINKKCVIINLHNGHDIPKKDLEDILDLDNECVMLNNSKDKNFENLNENIKTDFLMFENAYILCFGDFNGYHENLNVLFNGLSINLSLQNIKPHKTCCYDVAAHQGDYESINDYVLISDNLHFINQEILDYNEMSSDHKPVTSIINLNNDYLNVC